MVVFLKWVFTRMMPGLKWNKFSFFFKPTMSLANPVGESKGEHRFVQTKLVVNTLQILWIMYYSMHLISSVQFSSVQSLSRVRLFEIPWIAAHQTSLFIIVSRSSLRLMSIKSVMPSSHLILGHPLLLLPPIPPSIKVFSNESTLCMRWPKYWSFGFSIISSKEIPGLISFRMDWLDLLAVQVTLKSLLQHHSSKASILWHSAFFTVQLSHPYMTTGKTIALTRQIFVGKVMSLLFNMLSRLVITFLPRSKRLSISWHKISNIIPCLKILIEALVNKAPF